MADAIDFTDLSYEDILARIVADVLATPGLEGLDTSPASPDAYLLRAVAQAASRLVDYQNRMANKAFGTRALLRQSAIDHWRAIAYRMRGATAAVATLTFSVATGYPDPTPIPAGSPVETDDGAVAYETDVPTTLPAFATSVTVAATEGRSVEYTTVGASAASTPSGQLVYLAEPASQNDGEFLWGSERVWVAGDLWTRVEHFLSSGATSRHYVVDVDASGHGTVRFGDGVNGARPPEASQVLVRYRVGGGVRGRVRRGRLITLATRGIDVDVANGGETEHALGFSYEAGRGLVRVAINGMLTDDFTETGTSVVIGVGTALTRGDHITVWHLGDPTPLAPADVVIVTSAEHDVTRLAPETPVDASPAATWEAALTLIVEVPRYLTDDEHRLVVRLLDVMKGAKTIVRLIDAAPSRRRRPWHLGAAQLGRGTRVGRG